MIIVYKPPLMSLTYILYLTAPIMISMTLLPIGSTPRACAEPDSRDSSEVKFTESLELKTPSELWREPGLRIGLSYYEETYTGSQRAPSGSIAGVQVGVGARLDSAWSIESALRYGGGSGERSGLAFSGLLTAMYHYKHLGLGLGVGVAGISEQRDARANPYGDLVSGVVASYTVASDRAPLSQCVGFGPLAGVTLEYRLPLTSIMALHVATRLDRSRVMCELSTERVEPDSARGIVLRQYWEGWSWSWAGGLSWR